MKKLLALILAVVLCFLLVACGGNTSDNVVYLDETITIGDYEITITDTEFVDNWNPNGDSKEFCSEGNVHFVVHYTVKNVGTSKVYAPYKMLKLVYNNDYEFYEDAFDTYYYSFDTNSFVVNDNELAPLSQAKPCQTCIEVPAEVKENADSPLKLEITVDEETYVYNIRPIDEKQKEIFYNKGIDFMNEEAYKSAIRMFENAGDFSDAKNKFDEAAISYYIEAPYFGSAPEYFNTNKESYELLSGEDIKDFIIGEWNHSNITGRTVEFRADGTIDNNYKTGGLWEILGNMIKISDYVDATPDVYEVYKIKDGMYLFYRDGNNPSFSLKTSK